ncbi:unnamed protein product [Linum trigynum]|uniref:Uncharacterized protein n=1 Tax=Linum trigynum TaxID=586398 RepID=A0AAV2FJE3_9ROSI
MVNLSVSSVLFRFGRTRELEQRRPSTMAVYLVEEEIDGSSTNPRIASLIFVCVPVNLVSLRGAAGAKLRQRRSGVMPQTRDRKESHGAVGGAALYIAAYAHG